MPNLLKWGTFVVGDYTLEQINEIINTQYSFSKYNFPQMKADLKYIKALLKDLKKYEKIGKLLEKKQMQIEKVISNEKKKA